MQNFSVIKDIVILLGVALLSFWLGCCSISLVIDNPLSFVSDLANKNILTPIVVLFSAVVASLAARSAIHENYVMHKQNMTLHALRYNRFTEPGIRKITPVMEEINAKYNIKNTEDFNAYIAKKRKNSSKMKYYITVLDSYEHIAFGINNGYYDEKLAKLKIEQCLTLLTRESRRYIQWRENSDDSITGLADHGYKDLQELSNKWNPAKP